MHVNALMKSGDTEKIRAFAATLEDSAERTVDRAFLLDRMRQLNLKTA